METTKHRKNNPVEIKIGVSSEEINNHFDEKRDFPVIRDSSGLQKV